MSKYKNLWMSYQRVEYKKSRGSTKKDKNQLQQRKLKKKRRRLIKKM